MMNMITETVNINLVNKIDERCKKCFLKTYHRLFEKFNIEENKRLIFDAFYKEAILSMHSLRSPEIQRELNRRFCEITALKDPFEEEKKAFNQLALTLCNTWKPKVLAASDPFDMALRLATAGNIIDYGANNNFDVHATIDKVLSESFAINHSESLKTALANADTVLYLGDNAGEIAFDKLFLEIAKPRKNYYAVKGGPILNDATEKDALAVDMAEVAEVISNGYDAPSTVLKHSSRDFRKIFDTANVIISKGQGNLEGLISSNDSRIFFLLMIKCEVIAEILNVKKGDFVVFNHGLI